MKIAFLTEKYTPDIGGLAISAERLARLLTSAGHQVCVFAPSVNLPVAETRSLSSNGIHVTRFGAHRRVDETLVDWFELLIQEHNCGPFDVIHAYFLTHAGFVAAHAGRYLNVPSVVSARGNDLDRDIFDPARAAHILYTLQHASAITTNASELAKKASALISGLQISVIPNGVDTEHFKPLPRNNALAESLSLINRAPVEETSRVIGFAGELREKKGLRSLLSAYAQVNKLDPATLLIVGDIRAGEDKPIFEDFRLSHPEAQINVTGYVSPTDLPAYYSLMDVFVHPSLRDGLPNALLEAMACGKAVITTPVGGILDTVIDDENGRIVFTNHVDEFANDIQELLTNQELKKQLGRAACQTILDKFTLQSELNGNLVVYKYLGLKL